LQERYFKARSARFRIVTRRDLKQFKAFCLEMTRLDVSSGTH
jgi:hypothetical protein